MIRRIKLDASRAGEQEKNGMNSSDFNNVRYYTDLELAKEGQRVESMADITGKDSKVLPGAQSLVKDLLSVEGARFLWVFPSGVQFHKKVVANWHNETGDGVHDAVIGLLTQEIKKFNQEGEVEVKFIKGGEFPTAI
jgi:hypothetical protein